MKKKAMAKVAKKSKGGGSKPGERRGGRKKGTPNKKNAEKIKAIEASGITPLDYMLAVMRAPEPTREDDEDGGVFVARYIGWRDRAFEAAKASAPYCHPKLSAIEHTGKDGGPMDMHWTVEIIRPT